MQLRTGTSEGNNRLKAHTAYKNNSLNHSLTEDQLLQFPWRKLTPWCSWGFRLYSLAVMMVTKLSLPKEFLARTQHCIKHSRAAAGKEAEGTGSVQELRALTCGGAAVLRVLREGDGPLDAVLLHLLDRLLRQRVHVPEPDVVLVRRCQTKRGEVAENSTDP